MYDLNDHHGPAPSVMNVLVLKLQLKLIRVIMTITAINAVCHLLLPVLDLSAAKAKEEQKPSMHDWF